MVLLISLLYHKKEDQLELIRTQKFGQKIFDGGNDGDNSEDKGNAGNIRESQGKKEKDRVCSNDGVSS